MIMHEDLNKSYPVLVAYRQMILEYLIIKYQIIYSFEMDISRLLNLFIETIT